MRQFAIRDLMWFVLLSAVTIGWWADHRQQAETAERRIQSLEQENSSLVSKVNFLESYNRQPKTAQSR